MVTSFLGLLAALSSGSAVPLSSVEYEAGRSCPPRSAFEARILTRTSSASLGEGTRYRATIGSTGKTFVGVLSIGRGEERFPDRAVRGETCEVVADALALMIALSAAERDDSPEVPEPPRHAPRSPLFERPLDESRAEPGAEVVVVRGIDLALGFDLAAVMGALQETSAAFQGFLELVFGEASVRLGVSWTSRETEARMGPMTLSLGTVRFEACPLRSWMTEAWTLEPCARIDFGVVRGEALGVSEPTPDARYWVAPGVMGRARLLALDPVFLELSLGASAPLVRHRFYLEPDETLHEVAAIALEGGLGLGFALR